MLEIGRPTTNMETALDLLNAREREAETETEMEPMETELVTEMEPVTETETEPVTEEMETAPVIETETAGNGGGARVRAEREILAALREHESAQPSMGRRAG